MAKQADLFPTTSTPFALPEAERDRIEAEIQAHLDNATALIEELDRFDGDPDFCGSEHDGIEPDSDFEPSLGWTGDMNQPRALRSCLDRGEDMEAEHDGREPDEDLEAEHDGREPDEDLEPSLGWTASGSLSGAWDDRKQECEDEGACETALDVL